MNCKNWLFSLLALWLTMQSAYATEDVSSEITETSYALRVNTIPQGAEVKILNITPKFKQGMLLPAGKYDLKVSKAGYPTRALQVEIIDKNVAVDVVLGIVSSKDIPIFSAQYALFVNTIPQDADIKIMNISPEFYQGVVLAPGKYDIRVAKSGYATRDTTVTITDSDATIDVELLQNLPTEDNEADDSDDAVNTEESDTTDEVMDVEEPTDSMATNKTAESQVNTDNSTIETLKEQYGLYVDVIPEDASIKLLDSKVEFKQGLLLDPGKYTVVIAKSGYQSVNQAVEIVDDDMTLNVELKKEAYALSVKVVPEDAIIKIINIKPKFTQGILLASGSYTLNVSKEGYEAHEEVVEIVDKAITVEIELVEEILDNESTDEDATDDDTGNTDDAASGDENSDTTDDAEIDDNAKSATDKQVDKAVTNTPDSSTSMTIQAVETKEAVVAIPVDIKKDETVTKPVENTVIDTKKADMLNTSTTDKSTAPVKKEEMPVIKLKNDEIDTEDNTVEESSDISDDEVEDESDVDDDEADDDSESDDTSDDDETGDDSESDDTGDDDETGDDSESDDTGDDDEASTDDESDIGIAADGKDDDEETDTEVDQTEVATNKVDLSKAVVATDEQKVVVKPVETMTAMAPVIQSTPIETKPAAVSTEQSNSENIQIASVDKSSSNEILKAPISKTEILCFAFEETRQVKDQTDEMTIIHNSIIKLDNRFVEAVYDVYIKPSNLSYHYDFKGVKKGEKFDLIGILHYDAREQDVNSDMSIENKKLTINIKDGDSGDVMSNDVLKQTSCSDVMS